MRLDDDHDVELIQRMLTLGPVVMYADRLEVASAPARFLVTPNAERLVGSRPRSLTELFDGLAAVVDPDHRERLEGARTESMARRAVQTELQLRSQDGSDGWWRIETVAAEPALLMGFILDITEAVDAAGAEQRARAEAERSRDRAVAANQAKSEFLSRMSHELRTPLNSIVGFSQLLELQDLGAAERQWVDHVALAGKHLLALVDEVLDVAGIESGRFSVSLEPIDLVEIVDEAIDLMRGVAGEHRVTVERRPCDAPVWAFGDHRRVLQIIVNLVENGIRYNDPDGTVQIATGRTEDGTEVTVTDTGAGIEPEVLARVFQPFDRLGVERIGIEGTGMGLTVSRALAERMGGTLDITSSVGVGSVLRLELPAAAPPALHRPVDGATPLGSAGPADEQLLVLYIEDNVANLRLMEAVMELRPFVSLVTAMRGRLGFEIARDQQPDLVLVDLHLPDIGGREVLRLLRSDPSTASLVVAVVSADATPGTVDELRALGADHYLTKPIDIGDLTSAVDRQLERKRGIRGRVG